MRIIILHEGNSLKFYFPNWSYLFFSSFIPCLLSAWQSLPPPPLVVTTIIVNHLHQLSVDATVIATATLITYHRRWSPSIDRRSLLPSATTTTASPTLTIVINRHHWLPVVSLLSQCQPWGWLLLIAAIPTAAIPTATIATLIADYHRRLPPLIIAAIAVAATTATQSSTTTADHNHHHLPWLLSPQSLTTVADHDRHQRILVVAAITNHHYSNRWPPPATTGGCCFH